MLGREGVGPCAAVGLPWGGRPGSARGVSFPARVIVAVSLRASLIVVGESEVMTPERQALLIGEAWDRTPHDPELSTRFVVLGKDGRTVRRFPLGAHAPDLSSADVDHIHKLWVEAVKAVGPDIHHRDIVSAALDALEEDLASDRRNLVIDRLRQHASPAIRA